MAHELTISEFSFWLDRYKEYWETANAPFAVKLFTESATYRNSRFYAPYKGRDGIEEFWKYDLIVRKEDVKFSYEVMGCFGNVGMCRWKATLMDQADPDVPPKPKGHSGIFICHFASDKLVESLEEWRVIEFI